MIKFPFKTKSQCIFEDLNIHEKFRDCFEPPSICQIYSLKILKTLKCKIDAKASKIISFYHSKITGTLIP